MGDSCFIGPGSVGLVNRVGLTVSAAPAGDAFWKPIFVKVGDHPVVSSLISTEIYFEMCRAAQNPESAVWPEQGGWWGIILMMPVQAAAVFMSDNQEIFTHPVAGVVRQGVLFSELVDGIEACVIVAEVDTSIWSQECPAVWFRYSDGRVGRLMATVDADGAVEGWWLAENPWLDDPFSGDFSQNPALLSGDVRISETVVRWLRPSLGSDLVDRFLFEQQVTG